MHLREEEGCRCSLSSTFSPFLFYVDPMPKIADFAYVASILMAITSLAFLLPDSEIIVRAGASQRVVLQVSLLLLLAPFFILCKSLLV